MALVNPSSIQDAVQLVSRLDGMEVDRLREVNVATTAKPRRRKQEKSLSDALYDLRLECASSEEEVESPSEGKPSDIVAALAQVSPDFAEIYAATLANNRPGSSGQRPTKMTCFFCKDAGHTWLRCSKLWDQLKLNGFKPNMSRDKGGTLRKGLGLLVEAVPTRAGTNRR